MHALAHLSPPTSVQVEVAYLSGEHSAVANRLAGHPEQFTGVWHPVCCGRCGAEVQQTGRSVYLGQSLRQLRPERPQDNDLQRARLV